jgi:hypothetical protein
MNIAHLIELALGHAIAIHDEHLRKALVLPPKLAQQLLDMIEEPFLFACPYPCTADSFIATGKKLAP